MAQGFALRYGQLPLGAVTSAMWTWQLENAAGEAVAVSALSPGQTGVLGSSEQTAFPTQSDAESWVGEEWQNLLAAGVVAVTLYEGDRQVYGPMSLLPPD